MTDAYELLQILAGRLKEDADHGIRCLDEGDGSEYRAMELVALTIEDTLREWSKIAIGKQEDETP